MQRSTSCNMASTTSTDSTSDGGGSPNAVPLCRPSNFRVENGQLEHNEGSTRDDIVPCEEGLKLLEHLDEPLIVIGITGPARSGKSFFLSQLQEGVKFSIGHSRESHTTGIWIAVCPKTVEREGKRCRIVLLDAEGTSALSSVDEGASDKWDTKVFTLCSLISSVLIYNSSRQPTRNDIQQLGFIANFSNSVRQRPDSNLDEAREEIFKKYAPRFIWLIRDAMLQSSRKGTSADSDWNDYMTKEILCEKRAGHGTRNKVIRAINHTFSSTQAFGIPPPSIDSEICQKLDDPSVADEIKVFLTKIKEVASEIVEKSEIKKVHGDLVTGSKLVQLIKLYVEAINSETKYLSWENMWDIVIKTHLQNTLDDCSAQYTNALQNIKLPCPSPNYEENHNVAYKAALDKFEDSTSTTDQIFRKSYENQLTQRIENDYRSKKELNDQKGKEYCRQVIAQLRQKYLDPIKKGENQTCRMLLEAREIIAREYNDQTVGYASSDFIESESTKSISEEISTYEEKIINSAEATAFSVYDTFCETIPTAKNESALEDEHVKFVGTVEEIFKRYVDGRDDILQLWGNVKQKLDTRFAAHKEQRKKTSSSQCDDKIDTLTSLHWLPNISRVPQVSIQELFHAEEIIIQELQEHFRDVPGVKKKIRQLEKSLIEQITQSIKPIAQYALRVSVDKYLDYAKLPEDTATCIEENDLLERCNEAKNLSMELFNKFLNGSQLKNLNINIYQQEMKMKLSRLLMSVRSSNEHRSLLINESLMEELIQIHIHPVQNGDMADYEIGDLESVRKTVFELYDEQAVGPMRYRVRHKFTPFIDRQIEQKIRIKSATLNENLMRNLIREHLQEAFGESTLIPDITKACTTILSEYDARATDPTKNDIKSELKREIKKEAKNVLARANANRLQLVLCMAQLAAMFL